MIKFRTSKEIDYADYPYGDIAIIPMGTKCIPASNLPEEASIKFWVEPWKNMTSEAKSYMRNYGFGIREDEVEEIS